WEIIKKRMVIKAYLVVFRRLPLAPGLLSILGERHTFSGGSSVKKCLFVFLSFLLTSINFFGSAHALEAFRLQADAQRLSATQTDSGYLLSDQIVNTDEEEEPQYVAVTTVSATMAPIKQEPQYVAVTTVSATMAPVREEETQYVAQTYKQVSYSTLAPEPMHVVGTYTVAYP